MEILKEKTRSICPVCFKEIDARVIEEDRQVYLVKDCLTHGAFKILIEKNVSLYKKLMNNGLLDDKNAFNVLAISTTHSCNLECNYCYLPERDNHSFSLSDIKKIISGFGGSWIRLSGGEPTLREDLPQIIEYIVQSGKNAALLTNGIRLRDIAYVKVLKNAGLNWIHFSFNGMNDNVYKKIEGQKLLRVKREALLNIKKVKIPTALSVMLEEGINEKELKNIYRYCLRNNSFITQLRIRSSVPVGRYAEKKCFYLSEIVGMVSKVIGISEEKLVNNALTKGLYYSVHNREHMPCHLEIDLFSLLMDELGIGKSGNSLNKRIKAAFQLLPKVGITNLAKMFFRKLRKKERLLDFTVYIRVWPDKYRIDLGEIQRCPSAYIASDGEKILPFCYALILNKKNDML